MAQTKISQLTELSSIADNDVLAGVDTSAGTTKKVKMSTLKSYINTGDAQDVQINGTSVVTGNVANIAVEGTYNASTNKLETVNDVNSKTGTLSNLTTTNKTNLVSAINELNTNKEEVSNKITTIDENSTTTQYPNAKGVYDYTEGRVEDVEEELNETNNELAETQAELDQYKTIYNVLPKVSDEDESISLDGTGVAPLKIDLKGNTSQISYSGTNLFEPFGNGSITGEQTSSTSIATIKQTFNYTRVLTFNNGEITGNPGVGNGSYYIWKATFSGLKANTKYSFGVNYEYKNLTGTTGNLIMIDGAIVVQTGETSKSGWFVKVITTDENGAYVMNNFINTNVACCNENTTMRLYNIQMAEGEYTSETMPAYEPYVGGIPSPNPSYPQPIQVVSGDNEIQVCGKNLVDTLSSYSISGLTITKQADTSLLINGTISSNQTPQVVLMNVNYPSGTYRLSIKDENGNGYNSDVYINGAYTYKNQNDKTFVQATDIKTIRLYLYLNSGTYTNRKIFIQFEKGSTTTTYEPYTSTTYSISLDGNVYNKNMSYKNWYAKDDNGVETSSGYNGYITSYIKVEPSTQYTISGTITSNDGACRIYYYDSSKTWISRSDAYNQTQIPFTFTTPSNCYYIQFQYRVVGWDASTIKIMKVGITPIEIELCNIPNTNYKDKFFKAINGNTIYDNLDSTIKNTLDYGEWYLEKNVEKRILNGTETYTIASTPSGKTVFLLNDQRNKTYHSSTIVVIVATHLEGIKDNQGNVLNTIRGNNTGQIFITTSSIYNDVDVFKTFLSTNNITTYYILATPTYTKIEGTLASQLDDIANAISYPTQTNINQENNDLPFVINAETLLDISNLENRVTLLED